MNGADVEPRTAGCPQPLPVGVLCPDCGYDLRGSTSARCSECGFPLDVLRTRETQIPWSHRRELGRFKAYWKTVWLVLRHPKRFCLEILRPISYRDSQSFRWVTTLHAYLPILLGSALWCLFERLSGRSVGEDAWWILGGVLAWSLLLLVLLPGLASYQFQWRSLTVEQQNRTIALSYYAWAPLALTPLALPALPFFVAGALMVNPWGSTSQDLVRVFAPAGHVAAVLFSGLYATTFAQQTLRAGSRKGRPPTLVALPLAVLTLLLVLWPLCVFYLLVIYYSLR